MRHGGHLVLIALVSFFLFPWGCSRQPKAPNSPLSSSELNTLSTTRKMEDIFSKTAETQLELTENSAISTIIDFVRDSKGNSIVADGARMNNVWIFSSDGHFIQNLGRHGQGPGEYSAPWSLAVSPEGDILVDDYLGSRLIFYDRDYQYKKQISVKERIWCCVHVNHKNEIFTYEGTVPAPVVMGLQKPWIFDTIKKLNNNGETIMSFAPIPEEVFKFFFSCEYDGIAIDKDDFICEMNPLFYRIRKYTSDGQLVKSFVNPHFQQPELKHGQQVILNGPYYLEKGLLLVQLQNHLDIFDTEGNFLVGGIPLSLNIIYSDGNSFYVEKWEEPQSGQPLPNPVIISYKLNL